jgi:hypothetical protein
MCGPFLCAFNRGEVDDAVRPRGVRSDGVVCPVAGVRRPCSVWIAGWAEYGNPCRVKGSSGCGGSSRRKTKAPPQIVLIEEGDMVQTLAVANGPALRKRSAMSTMVP